MRLVLFSGVRFFVNDLGHNFLNNRYFVMTLFIVDTTRREAWIFTGDETLVANYDNLAANHITRMPTSLRLDNKNIPHTMASVTFQVVIMFRSS